MLVGNACGSDMFSKYVLFRDYYLSILRLCKAKLVEEEKDSLIMPVFSRICMPPMVLPIRIKTKEGGMELFPVISYFSRYLNYKYYFYNFFDLFLQNEEYIDAASSLRRLFQSCQPTHQLVSYTYYRALLKPYGEAKTILLFAYLNHCVILRLLSRLRSYHQLKKITEKLLWELYGLEIVEPTNPRESMTFTALTLSNMAQGVHLIYYGDCLNPLRGGELSKLRRQITQNPIGNLIAKYSKCS
jgi:hypothetical protein